LKQGSRIKLLISS